MVLLLQTGCPFDAHSTGQDTKRLNIATASNIPSTMCHIPSTTLEVIVRREKCGLPMLSVMLMIVLGSLHVRATWKALSSTVDNKRVAVSDWVACGRSIHDSD